MVRHFRQKPEKQCLYLATNAALFCLVFDKFQIDTNYRSVIIEKYHTIEFWPFSVQ